MGKNGKDFARCFYMELLKNVSYWYRSCAVCSVSFPTVQWFCRSCWKRLKSYYLQPQNILRLQNEFSHIRLLDWTKENDTFMRLVLNSLKISSPEYIYDHLIQDLFYRAVQGLPSFIGSSGTIIPAPPRKNFLNDHAFYLAKALSQLTRWPIQLTLKRVESDSSQKQKSKIHRKKISFELKYPVSKDSSVIFVDDILTTGATAIAAKNAIGEVKHFKVLTLSWRQAF